MSARLQDIAKDVAFGAVAAALGFALVGIMMGYRRNAVDHSDERTPGEPATQDGSRQKSEPSFAWNKVIVENSSAANQDKEEARKIEHSVRDAVLDTLQPDLSKVRACFGRLPTAADYSLVFEIKAENRTVRVAKVEVREGRRVFPGRTVACIQEVLAGERTISLSDEHEGLWYDGVLELDGTAEPRGEIEIIWADCAATGREPVTVGLVSPSGELYETASVECGTPVVWTGLPTGQWLVHAASSWQGALAEATVSAGAISRPLLEFSPLGKLRVSWSPVESCSKVEIQLVDPMDGREVAEVPCHETEMHRVMARPGRWRIHLGIETDAESFSKARVLFVFPESGGQIAIAVP